MKKGNLAGIAEAAVSIFLTVGALTIFKVCEGGVNGKYMTCHWAQNAVVLAGIVLSVQSLLRILIPNKGVKTGLSLSIFLLAAAVIFIPNTAINLCMMETMRCHTVFKPAVIVTSSVLTVISGLDAVIGLIRTGKE
ncbi:protein of unknown function [Ruminococcus sp. YE71]|uniref:DUF4418 family protein n=1 Tax=unclassified Ruminococcus TaxID=2608920 RepID=UPI0008916587|nr:MULTISPECIES: DUF4418 family protein [unclassified Ruminococcus]SDA24283.1 protein of unknown function [Ruminococcus sp. YE78]SFW41760.1 protein of unknown function [Ruminococcus sp. YE71]